jgi:hypothetical protein
VETLEELVGQEVQPNSGGVEVESAPLESWRPTSSEGRVISPNAALFMFTLLVPGSSVWDSKTFAPRSTPRNALETVVM